MIELKIDPEFENLIPKLTDAEYAQLEKNILADGKVKEPIVVWNGTIIDGHHRYYIVKKHPEIPFEIEEKDFANKYAAMAWACANQLGRRNLNTWQHDYLIGKRQENEKLAYGLTSHDEKGRFKSNRESENPTFGEKITETASKIANDEKMNRAQVYEDQKLAKGLDTADEVVDGLKDKILNREVPVSKTIIRQLGKATPDIQRKASIAISEGRVRDAKKILSPEPEQEPYNIGDMTEEIRAAAGELHSALNQTLIVMHSEVLADAKNRDKAKKCLQEIVDDVQEFITKISN